jgi:hypothetical protein
VKVKLVELKVVGLKPSREADLDLVPVTPDEVSEWQGTLDNS